MFPCDTGSFYEGMTHEIAENWLMRFRMEGGPQQRLSCVFQFEPQEPKQQNINLKVGFPPIPERARTSAFLCVCVCGCLCVCVVCLPRPFITKKILSGNYPKLR